MAELKLKVLTPGGVVFEGPADEVRLPGVQGEFGVLPDHSALISSLVIGQLTFTRAGSSNLMAIHGGVVHVEDDLVTVFAENAEFANSIDRPRAEAARDRAELRIKELESELLVFTEEYTTHRGALQRALTRLQVAEEK